MQKYSSTLIILLSLLFISCSSKKESEVTSSTRILATVGTETIDEEEFLLNYEFGFAHLRRPTEISSDPKRSYLYLMIYEKLLAKEGYKNEYHLDPDIIEREERMLDELLVEQVFFKNVHDNIEMSDQEIRDAAIKSRVKFKLRYLPALSFQQAVNLKRNIDNNGFASVMDEKLLDVQDLGIKPWHFESGEVTFLDIDPAMFDGIKDLEIGGISDPILIEGVYYIAQLLDFKREPISENDIVNEWAKWEKILFAQKAKRKASMFVSRLMEPKNVVVNADSFRILAEALWNWYNEDQPTINLYRALQGLENQSYAQLLKANLNITLVTHSSGSWSIGEFLQRFANRRYPLRLESIIDFTSNLETAIGLTVRDSFMLKEAQTNNYASTEEVQRELKLWKDKWVFRKMKEDLVNHISITDQELQIHFAMYPERFKMSHQQEIKLDNVYQLVYNDLYKIKKYEYIQTVIDSLTQNYKVKINEVVLASIDVTDESYTTSFMIFKNSTGRVAYPAVDPNW